MKEESWDKELLNAIWGERMSLCYKMLLICKLIDGSDLEGKMPLRKLAEDFRQFFRDRNAAGKKEDNPNRFKHGEAVLSDRSVEEWERIIVEEPLSHIKTLPIRHDGKMVFWNSDQWRRWSTGYRLAIKKTAGRVLRETLLGRAQPRTDPCLPRLLRAHLISSSTARS